MGQKVTIIQLMSRASHHLQKKRTRSLSGSFSFRGLCAAMPCRLRREPLRAGAAFMRVNSLTSLLRKRCLLRPLISTTDKKDEPDHCRVLFLFYFRNRVRLSKEKGNVKQNTRRMCIVAYVFFTISLCIENKCRQSYAEVSTKFNI